MADGRASLDMLLLAALRRANVPLHGYALIEDLRATSGGVFNYAEGTIYPALHQMELEGLVQSSWDTSGSRRRRLYRLTSSGGAALAERANAWSRYASAVSKVLQGAS
jgi:DNA-binding PadR family transcriptional regulator